VEVWEGGGRDREESDGGTREGDCWGSGGWGGGRGRWGGKRRLGRGWTVERMQGEMKRRVK